MNEFIKSGADPAEKMIKGLLDCELDFINVGYVDFSTWRHTVIDYYRSSGYGWTSMRMCEYMCTRDDKLWLQAHVLAYVSCLLC